MNFLLDTNVVSELQRRSPSPSVLSWIEDQASDDLYVSVLTVGEIRTGIENLRRREAEHSIGRWVPRGDDTVQVLANDGIIGAGNNRREESLQTLLLRDIPGNFGSANHAPGGVSDRRHRKRDT